VNNLPREGAAWRIPREHIRVLLEEVKSRRVFSGKDQEGFRIGYGLSSAARRGRGCIGGDMGMTSRRGAEHAENGLWPGAGRLGFWRWFVKGR